MLLLFIHAYSLGGGTYTGIEAVSNGLPIMREPRIQTAKRTMLYLSVSLAITAGGLIVCYLLWNVGHVDGKTMNATLAEKVGADRGQISVLRRPVKDGLGNAYRAGLQKGLDDGYEVLVGCITVALIGGDNLQVRGGGLRPGQE